MKRKGNTNHRLSAQVVELLRQDYGCMARIARRLNVNKSTVSRVVHGKKTSARVRGAVIRECQRVAKAHSAAALLMALDESQK